MTAPVRVLLVDDQALVRAGFRMVLDAQPDICVVGEASDGVEAVALADRLAPDIALMDIRMPRLDGVAATRRIVTEHPTTRVIVLTTFDLDEYVYAALGAGASGFLLKDAGPEDLLAAIRAVHSGDAVVAPSATRRLLDRLAPRLADNVDLRTPDERLAALTAREREVLAVVGRGLTNAEIADELFLSEATVKTHIGHILAKLSLRDRVQMVVLAYDAGLVRPRP
ncbi:response regulator transcription factor [Raineyella sp. LH-20]|uniref:response regulator transcription factor n=1 Tax=Raineyella sp. LH-20 TaxID=3081204 RepID=UPI00295418C5|nr:response regulator transcription factor [Raineyella sp. LH-20]WOP19161.1 response regulator transcription factor [Raineyella sp. LH-20]